MNLHDSLPGIVIIALLACGLPLAHAATFVVNSTIDNAGAHDDIPGDGVCDSGGGTCTLRAAIEEANSDPTRDRIEFSVSGVFTPFIGAYPTVTESLVIDGRTAPGYNDSATEVKDAPPTVILNGLLLNNSTQDGLQFDAGAGISDVYALTIIGFPGNGIFINGAPEVWIQGCHIGVNSDGNADANDAIGILAANSDGHAIGLTVSGVNFAGLGNVISSNGGSGISLSNVDLTSIRGNIVGLAPNGVTPRGNGGNGITVIGDSNEIGRASGNLRAGNLVADNTMHGIVVLGDSNLIRANTIGLNSDRVAVGNGGDGIRLSGNENRIGSGSSDPNVQPANDEFNEIADNEVGIRLGTSGGASALNTLVADNFIGVADVAVGNRGSGLVVENGGLNTLFRNEVVNNGTGNTHHGIDVQTDSNVINGNHIGWADLGGPAARSNSGNGLNVAGNQNEIGTLDAPNVIGFNDHGIFILGNNNMVYGNYLGMTEAGDDIANGGSGIFVFGSGNDIGKGPVPNHTGYDGEGIRLNGDSNMVRGNRIGITPSLGNAGHDEGIYVFGSNNQIGSAAEPNIIGHSTRGIYVNRPGSQIHGNLIGVGPAGENIANGTGIFFLDGNESTVGSPGTGNFIGFNSFGLVLNSSAGNVIEDNRIGLTQGGSPAGNLFAGIKLDTGTSKSEIKDNTIAWSGGPGVHVLGTEGNRVSENSMFRNTGLPIDIDPGGPNANDANDADGGPNRRMNYPEVLDSVTDFGVTPPEVEISYRVDALSGNADYPLTIEFFYGDGSEPTQGRNFLGSQTYAIPGATEVYNDTLPVNAFNGRIVMTATDASGNTSELSPVQFVGAGAIFSDSFEDP